jgi:MFS transporter, SHS family, sialic acid transporter
MAHSLDQRRRRPGRAAGDGLYRDHAQRRRDPRRPRRRVAGQPGRSSHNLFLVSLASFALGEYIYLFLLPSDTAFFPCVFMLGLISTIFFGWLPLYLPELFPTEARSTGAGVSFNWGRILGACGVLAAGVLTKAFEGDYGRAGSITTLIYAVGMLVILFAPDTTKTKLSA